MRISLNDIEKRLKEVERLCAENGGKDWVAVSFMANDARKMLEALKDIDHKVMSTKN
jgi:hypothetical protein